MGAESGHEPARSARCRTLHGSRDTAHDHPFEDPASTRLGQFFGPAGDKHPGPSGLQLWADRR